MIAVDANILMELIENRKHVGAVRQATAANRQQGEKLGVSTLSLSHAFYLAEAHKIPLDRVEVLAAGYEIYDVIASDAEWALAHYQGKDFEDALQAAAALREKCTEFWTLDVSLAKKYAKFLNVRLIGDR